MIGTLIQLIVTLLLYRYLWLPAHRTVSEYLKSKGIANDNPNATTLLMGIVHCIVTIGHALSNSGGGLVVPFVVSYFAYHATMSWQKFQQSPPSRNGGDGVADTTKIIKFALTIAHHVIATLVLQGWMLIDSEDASRMFGLGEIPVLLILIVQLTGIKGLENWITMLYLIYRVIGFPLLGLRSCIPRHGIWLLISPLNWIRLVPLVAIWGLNVFWFVQLTGDEEMKNKLLLYLGEFWTKAKQVKMWLFGRAAPAT